VIPASRFAVPDPIKQGGDETLVSGKKDSFGQGLLQGKKDKQEKEKKFNNRTGVNTEQSLSTHFTVFLKMMSDKMGLSNKNVTSQKVMVVKG
jgi:hypothetical protein